MASVLSIVKFVFKFTTEFTEEHREQPQQSNQREENSGLLLVSVRVANIPGVLHRHLLLDR